MEQHERAEALSVATFWQVELDILTAGVLMHIARTHTLNQDAAVPVEQSTHLEPAAMTTEEVSV